MIQTPVQNDLPSGTYDTTIVAPVDFTGSFFIADAILEARDKGRDLTGYYPNPVQVVSKFSADTGSTYKKSLGYIIIQAGEADVYYWPDIYDKSVILHEYGHHIEYTMEFFDASEGGLHAWYSVNTPELAATEGFAHFTSCLFRNDPISINYNGDFSIWSWTNIENGEMGYSNSPEYYTANNFGEKCEGAVAGIIWDIYDNADDDYSSFPPSYGPDPDGIWDTLSNGTGNIRDVLLYRSIDGHQPDNINEFWDAWFQAPSKGHPKAMRDIWYEHGIIQFICGDANGDGEVNVGDAVFLISYIFKYGPAPEPLDSGDANSDGIVNIGDPVYLINYIYRGGQPPCP